VVGLVSLWYPQVWGNGYSVIGTILTGQLAGTLLLTLFVAKVVSTAATVGSGAVGGIFTPTLFIGAAVGALANAFLHLALPAAVASTPGAYALVGMGGLLSATTHAPLTSILMIFEMTLDYDVVLPLMLACVTAHYTAKVYRSGRSVYHDALQPVGGEATAWQLRTVEALVKPAPAVVGEATTVREMLDRLPRRAVQAVYVVDESNQLQSVLDPREVMDRIKSGEIHPDDEVGALRGAVPFVLTPDMSLAAALDGFLREQVKVLPVTAGQWHMTLLGEVSRHDLLLAVQDRISGKG
jgi:CIC family chloride channel protein